MDIERFKNTLEILKGLGVTECGIESKEGATLVRGVSDDRAIGIYSTVPYMGNPENHGIGILSINGVLSRIELFDLDKVTFDFTEERDFISFIKMKQGRRRGTIRTTSPSSCAIPSLYPDFEKVMGFDLPFELVQTFQKAHASLKMLKKSEDLLFSIEESQLNEGEYVFCIQSGEDKFLEEIKLADGWEHTHSGKTEFQAEPMLRAIKQSSIWSENKGTSILIDDRGHATLYVDEIKILVTSLDSTLSQVD